MTAATVIRSKEQDKDQESIQTSSTHIKGHHMGVIKTQESITHNYRAKIYQPFPNP